MAAERAGLLHGAGGVCAGSTARGERQSGRSGQLAQRRIQRQLGLGRSHADEAYAAGYTGKGQKVGIFDTPVNHPEFAGDGKLINVVTEGYRAYTDPHRPGINAGDLLLRRHLPLLPAAHRAC